MDHSVDLSIPDFLKSINKEWTEAIKNTYIHQTQNFRRFCPVGPVFFLKKHKSLGHAGIVDHSVDLSIPDFKKVFKKRNGQKQ